MITFLTKVCHHHHLSWMSASYYHFSLVISPPFYFHNYIIYFKDCKNWTKQTCNTSASEQYIRWQNRHWHSVFLTDHDLLLVICLFPAILFSLSASYNLIIFYELTHSLVICPFPRHFIFIISLFISIITFLTKVCHHYHLSRTSASYYYFLALSLIVELWNDMENMEER